MAVFVRGTNTHQDKHEYDHSHMKVAFLTLLLSLCCDICSLSGTETKLCFSARGGTEMELCFSWVLF